MINVVGSIPYVEEQRTTTLTTEQVSKSCNAVIEAMKNELPKEAHSIEVLDFILEKSKELLHSMTLELK